MDTKKETYKIFLTIHNSNDTDIYFKRDGKRFDSEYTVKFQTDTQYEFCVMIKPSLPLKSVSVQGVGVSVVDSTNQDANNNGGCKYQFQWETTGIGVSRRKDRSHLQLLLQFQDGVSLTLPLQVKLYSADQFDHLTWGQPLHQIDYDCELTSGSTYLDIVKEVYR